MPNAKNAREAAAATAAAAEKQRRVKVALTYTGIVATLLVLVVVFAFVAKAISKSPAPASTGLASSSSSNSAQPSLTSEQVLARDIKILTTIPASTYDAVGPGSAAKLKTTSGPALTEDGKPVVVYVGAEFCPFCAGQRWALIAALSRFGTWDKLGRQSSSADDVYASTSTFTFHGATYTSKYLVFSGTEALDGNRNPLDTPPARDSQVWTTLGQSSFPFLDLGGMYAMSGAQFQPTSLHVDAGDSQSAPRSWDEIANALTDPTSAQSKQILGAANILTAELCTLTNNQPANVCNSAGVVAAR
ncbi:DUF929 family protein [Nocardioides baekrokdamisoli]|nr:DUF929 family protein [Nocardioides baekrokdamisoli]